MEDNYGSLNAVYPRLLHLLDSYVSGIAMDEISPSSLLAQDLCLNSFDTVSLVGDIEDCFGIIIDIKAVFNMRTIQDVVNYISEGSKVNADE